MVTDEMGLEIARYKYYPFGHYAETSSGSDVRMKFTGHERDESLGLDYMLARYYSAGFGRFLSVDSSRGSMNVRGPATWNRYSYVLNAPLLFIDPDGLLHLAFDFQDSSLSAKQQARVMANVRQQFRNAGVKDVTAGQMKFSEAKKARRGGGDVAPIKIQDEKIVKTIVGEGYKKREVLGSTPPPFDHSFVSTNRASNDPDKQVTFATNVAGHEAGHQTLPGSGIEHHETAEPGSLMSDIDTDDSAVLETEVREFDAAHAEALREQHNED